MLDQTIESIDDEFDNLPTSEIPVKRLERLAKASSSTDVTGDSPGRFSEEWLDKKIAFHGEAGTSDAISVMLGSAAFVSPSSRMVYVKGCALGQIYIDAIESWWK